MSLVDWVFDAYTVRREGLSGELDYLVTYIIVTCNDDTSVATAELVTHRKGLQDKITFILKVGEVNVITST